MFVIQIRTSNGLSKGESSSQEETEKAKTKTYRNIFWEGNYFNKILDYNTINILQIIYYKKNDTENDVKR